MPVQFWSQVMVSKKNENCSVEVLSCDVVYDAVECGAKFECVKSSNLTIQMEAAEHRLVFAAFFFPVSYLNWLQSTLDAFSINVPQYDLLLHRTSFNSTYI